MTRQKPPRGPVPEPRLNQAQETLLELLARGPMATVSAGSGVQHTRMLRDLVDLGLAHYADLAAIDVPRPEGNRCVITPAGRTRNALTRDR